MLSVIYAPTEKYFKTMKTLSRIEAETQWQIYFEELNSIQMKTTAMLLNPSKAAGMWSDKTKMELSVAIFSIIQVTIYLWRQLRYHPDIQQNTTYTRITFPENLIQLINSQLLTFLRGTEPPPERVLGTRIHPFTTWFLFIYASKLKVII